MLWVEELATPGVVFLLMLIVGLETDRSNLKKTLAAPRLLVAGVVGQLVLVPSAAGLLVALLEPSEAVAIGLLLIAISPAGTISNYYVYLAEGNTELSILLTMAGSSLGFLTVPFIQAAGPALFPDRFAGMKIETAALTASLFSLTVIPIAGGMFLRWLFPAAAKQSRSALRLVGMTLLGSLVFFILAVRWRLLQVVAFESLILSVLFTFITMLAGFLAATLLGAQKTDRIALMIEFPCRNLAIALLLAASMGQLDFAAFGVVVFLVQALVIATMAALHRWIGDRRRTEIQ